MKGEKMINKQIVVDKIDIDNFLDETDSLKCEEIANQGLEIVVKNSKYGACFFNEVIVPCIYDNYDSLDKALKELMKDPIFVKSLIKNYLDNKTYVIDFDKVILNNTDDLENIIKKLEEISKGHKVDVEKLHELANQDDFIVGYDAHKLTNDDKSAQLFDFENINGSKKRR